VAVVMAAIVRHRPAIHGEGVGSRRWAYGAVPVDMHTQGVGLRAQRPGGLFLGRRRTKRRRRCSTRPRYQAHTVPCGVASLDAALSVLPQLSGCAHTLMCTRACASWARTSLNDDDQPVEVAALPSSPSSHQVGKARNSTWDGHPAQWPLGSDDGRSTSVSLVALLRKRQLRCSAW
jgi:hypothetical protein